MSGEVAHDREGIVHQGDAYGLLLSLCEVKHLELQVIPNPVSQTHSLKLAVHGGGHGFPMWAAFRPGHENEAAAYLFEQVKGRG